MVERKNPDLDAVLGDAPGLKSPLPKIKKRRKPSSLDRDKSRRLAFKVLALLADLGAKERQRVLNHAIRLNRG